MVNPEDKGGSISVSRSFANGGRVGLHGWWIYRFRLFNGRR
jgi:hypothetical protein